MRQHIRLWMMGGQVIESPLREPGPVAHALADHFGEEHTLMTLSLRQHDGSSIDVLVRRIEAYHVSDDGPPNAG